MNQTFNLSERINDGQVIYGTFLAELMAPGVIDVLANNNLDFALVDAEHGMYSLSVIQELISASHRAGIFPMVRVPGVDRGFVTKILDSGARGVIFPQIRSIEQVLEAVQISKFPPMGSRGLHGYRPHTNFKRPADWPEFFEHTNRSNLTIVQIETKQILDQLDLVAATEGVDVLYVGPADLAAELGCPGEWDNAKVQGVFRKVVQVCGDHGKIAGAHIGTVDQATALIDMGFRIFGYAAAIAFLESGVKSFLADVPHSVK